MTTSSRRPLTRTRRLCAMGAVTGALTLSVAACSSGSGSSSSSAEPSTSASSTSSADASATPANEPEADGDTAVGQGGPKVAYKAAAATARQKVPGGKVTEVEYDDEDGDWEVDVMTDEPRVHNITVDATSGAVTRDHQDRMPDSRRGYLKIPLAKLAAASLSLGDAAGKALKEIGAGFVSKVSIQGTENHPQWEVEITDGRVRHELDIDAKTGEVVSEETDRED